MARASKDAIQPLRDLVDSVSRGNVAMFYVLALARDRSTSAS